jgi:S1-C subfamily serine protease
LTVGTPLGLEATVSDGLVSAFRVEEGTRQVQISAPTSPGSSGGPVITSDGKVIGLVVSGITGGGAENLNFALPINYARGELALASSKSALASATSSGRFQAMRFARSAFDCASWAFSDSSSSS